jgi:DICT domain-containing protein
MLEGSILKKLVEAHLQGELEKTPLNYGVYYKNTLVALCHALEDSILASDASALMVTAFQRGKWYLQEADRYGEIADCARQVVILAAPDAGFLEHPTSQKPNVAIVSLNSDDPVAQEWHLIILSPTYTAMVLCQELTPEDYGVSGVPKSDLERKFYGFWTFEPELVRETIELAIDCIEEYDTQLQQTLRSQVGEIVQEAAETDHRADLSEIVSRVVHYLKISQQDLVDRLDSTSSSYQQTLDHNLISNELQAFLRMAQLIDLTDTGNPMAAAEVSSLAEMMGQLLDLPAWQLKRLRLAGLLHRLDYLPGIANGFPSSENVAPCCPLRPAAQVLRTMPQLRAVAKIVTHQTEYWNGSGQPAGLAYDAIPLESRILGLVAYFQQRVVQLMAEMSQEEALTTALGECQEQTDLWDPKLLETLTLLVMGIQQGMKIPMEVLKVSSGLWLLDDRTSVSSDPLSVIS